MTRRHLSSLSGYLRRAWYDTFSGAKEPRSSRGTDAERIFASLPNSLLLRAQAQFITWLFTIACNRYETKFVVQLSIVKSSFPNNCTLRTCVHRRMRVGKVSRRTGTALTKFARKSAMLWSGWRTGSGQLWPCGISTTMPTAESLNCTQGAVNGHLHRARKIVRLKLRSVACHLESL